jgi:xanthine phosphoribosyltransferase
MERLEQRILRDGKILPGGILKVDGFLNHQIDPQLLYEMALELKRLYEGERITKVLTIEASGIAIASMTGFVLGCPLLFAKKSKSKNIADDVYAVEVESFTHGNTNTVVCSKE